MISKKLPLVKKVNKSYVQTYLQTIVMAGLDGITTVVVVLAACIGCQVGLGILLILALSKLVGGAIDLTFQNLLTSYQDKIYLQKIQKREREDFREIFGIVFTKDAKDVGKEGNQRERSKGIDKHFVQKSTGIHRNNDRR